MARKKFSTEETLAKDGRQVFRHDARSPFILVRKLKRDDEGDTRHQVDLGTVNGRRMRKTFPNADDAIAHAVQVSRERGHGLEAVSAIPQEVQAVLMQAHELMAGQNGYTVLDAVEYFLKRKAKPTKGDTVAEVVEAFLDVEKGRLDRGLIKKNSYNNMQSYTKKLISELGGRGIGTLDEAEDIVPCLNNYTGTTRANVRNKWAQFFAWCVDQNYITTTPMTKASIEKVQDRGRPAIYTTKQVETIMRATERLCPKLIPKMAICFFAGVRASKDGEISRLEWKDVHFDSGIIEIPASKSKKRMQDRDIIMSANLKKWLAPYVNESGLVHAMPPTTEDKWRMAIFRECGFGPIKNGARHSFASFSLKAHGDLNRAIDEMGHMDSRVFKKHYDHKRITAAMGKAYFGIVPTPAGKVVVFPKAKAS